MSDLDSNDRSICTSISRYDIIVVGGGPGGITAALTSKMLYRDKSVLLIKSEEKTLIPCSIPYLVASIDECDKALISYAPLINQGVAVEVDTVIDINRGKKVVVTASGKCHEYTKLILATGSIPHVIQIEGINLENVVVVSKRYESARSMQKVLRAAESVTIIGCGFVGVEIADELLKLRKNVVIVEALPYCLSLIFDEEISRKVEEILKREGVKIFTGRTVKRIYGSNKVEGVELDSGERIEVDAVVVAIGHKPNIELAKKIGLKLGKYGVAVDGYMRTSDPDIYAVGDVAEKRHFLLNEPIPAMLSSVACHEARVAAANLYSDRRISVEGTVGVFITKVRDFVIGCAGVNESLLKKNGVDYIVGRAKSINRHPFFLPGACEIDVKLLFLKNGVIVGAQVSGYCNEVAEITNALALAIQKKMRIEEIIALQYGTQPVLTASPISNPIVLAALKGYEVSNIREPPVGKT